MSKKAVAKVVVIVVLLELVCGFILILPHIDIAKGKIGQQEVTSVRIFDNLLVADEKKNRRYWQGVEDFFFTEDALIVEAKDNVTITVGRREMNLKTFTGKAVKVVYDFSELTLVYENEKESPYYGVKAVELDKRQRVLNMLYFNGQIEQIRIQGK